MTETSENTGRPPTNQSANHEWDAATYDAISDPQARWGAVMLDRLVLEGDETVLDAGCGSGRVTEALLERLPRGRVIALDRSRAMLETARQRLERYSDRVSYVAADLLELTLDDLGSPVDAVFSTATFHWVTDHELLYARLHAIMEPGAQLVAQCGGAGNIDRLIAIVRALGQERAGTWEYASADETRTRLSQAGFVDIETWLHAEPTAFATTDDLLVFLEKVCLRDHVAQMTPEERQAFLESVTNDMPERTIDYIRLNMVARRN